MGARNASGLRWPLGRNGYGDGVSAVPERAAELLKGETMAVLRHVVSPAGMAAGRGYSHVVTGRGRLVVISGQVAQDEHGELVGPGDAGAQARQVFENLGRCLAAVNAGFVDVVKLGFYVLDVADLPAVRAARDAVIDTA